MPWEDIKNELWQWQNKDAARNVIRHDDERLTSTMFELAWTCRDLIIQSPADGPDLGTVLIGHKFRAIFGELGLALVPTAPTATMRTAWKNGWFRTFHERFQSMLSVIWETEKR
jgi:hypothetical protein